MFPLIFEVTTTGMPVREQRRLKAHIKRSLTVMLYYWLAKYFPCHFSTVAYTRYPGIYAKRKAAFSRSGARLVKNPAPQIETGAAKDLAESSFTVSGTPALLTARMRFPWWSFAHKHINTPKEIAYVNRQEAEKMAAVFGEDLAGRLNNDPVMEKVTIR